MLSWFENIGGPTALVFFGAFLSAIGGFWAAQRQAQRNDNIDRLNAKIAVQQEQLTKKSDEISSTVSRMETALNQLVAAGKITKEDAQRILEKTLEDTVNFEENLGKRVIRTPESKN